MRSMRLRALPTTGRPPQVWLRCRHQCARPGVLLHSLSTACSVRADDTLTGFAIIAVAALLNDLAALVSRRAARQRDLRWGASSISKDAAAQAVAADAAAAGTDAAVDDRRSADMNGGGMNNDEDEAEKVCLNICSMPVCVSSTSAGS